MLNKLESVEKAWEFYVSCAWQKPPETSSFQYKDAKRAFFAGAIAVLEMQKGIAAKHEGNRNVIATKFQSLELQCIQFASHVVSLNN